MFQFPGEAKQFLIAMPGAVQIFFVCVCECDSWFSSFFYFFPRLWFCRDGNGRASTERYRSDETGLGRGDKIGEATSQPMNFNHPLPSVSYHIGILTFQDFIFSIYTYYCQHLLQRLKMNAIQPLPSIGRYLQQCVHLWQCHLRWFRIPYFSTFYRHIYV